MQHNLQRFLEAQNQTYLKAFEEISNGKKVTHWMWYIFPQIQGLGQSETTKFFGIADIDEATAFLEHPVLGKHLVQISAELLRHEAFSATEIFGYPDDMKLKSSMTLFVNVSGSNQVFEEVLNVFFNGVHDERTLQILQKQHQPS